VVVLRVFASQEEAEQAWGWLGRSGLRSRLREMGGGSWAVIVADGDWARADKLLEAVRDVRHLEYLDAPRWYRRVFAPENFGALGALVVAGLLVFLTWGLVSWFFLRYLGVVLTLVVCSALFFFGYSSLSPRSPALGEGHDPSLEDGPTGVSARRAMRRRRSRGRCGICGTRVAGTLDRCPSCRTQQRPGPAVPLTRSAADSSRHTLPAGGPLQSASREPAAGRALARARHQRRVRRRVVATVALVLVAAGVVVLVSVRAASREVLSADPPTVRLTAGDGVPAADRALVVQLAQVAESTLASRAGGHLRSLELFVDVDVEALAERLADRVGVTTEEAARALDGFWVTAEGALFLDLSGGAIEGTRDFSSVAHEVAHAFEWALSAAGRGHLARGCDDPATPTWRMPLTGPAWLAEGIAEWLAFQVYADSAYWPADQDRQEATRALLEEAFLNLDRPLKSLAETGVWEVVARKGREGYAMAALAGQLLASRSGDAALLAYWKYMAEGLCWDTAFTQAFGLTPGSFYASYEQHRREAAVLVPPPDS
jgi:hypothetical protein